ncbi:MAG TPA: phospholipase D-like domain-containing protein [Thermoanaerobaculia bacterium]|nr:phospholipase D-like domain-containing protein [Thermoanaerobaculia bacterium]
MHEEHRRKHNEEFIRRLIKRRPELAPQLEYLLKRRTEEAAGMAMEGLDTGAPPEPAVEIALETIVNDERPVLFVVNDRLDTNQVTIKGIEAQDLVGKMKTADEWLSKLMPLVGRVDVSNFPGEYVGTGWFVDENIVVTNRHVASLIARHDGRKFVFKLGVGNRPIGSDFNTTHEFDDTGFDASRNFKVDEVLYIEPDAGPNDIAFLKVRRRASGVVPKSMPVARTDVGAERLVCAIGYPARASRRVIPDQQLMDELYRGKFDIKRAAPGFTTPMAGGTTRHDCTTLGGNSGSVVIDLVTKEAVGLHFAGLYQETNFAVRASVLRQYIDGKRWNQPLVVNTRTPKREDASAAAAQAQSTVTTSDAGVVNITVPLEISLRLGTPITGPVTATVTSSSSMKKDPESVAIDFWRSRPEGVTGVRVGYEETEDGISDEPFLSVSAPASKLDEIAAAGPKQVGGLAVRYEAADVLEQLESDVTQEGKTTTISYDDDARTGEEFSFDPVTEQMELRLHVGPEYSWDELHQFLDESKGHLVSAMYEFHAVSVKDAIEARLDDGASMTLVLDNATFVPVKNEDEEIHAEDVFDDWRERFDFDYQIVPEGATGLIANSYHIKVTVRDDNKFWLSSGNWKMKSSQPVVTENDRLNIDEKDLPGNREWHVIVKNKTLAGRFRSHINQDFNTSRELAGEESPESALADVMVDVPAGIELERKKPSRLLEPKTISGKFKVQPLLTPDDEGGVFTRAVVDLIKSAKKSLLFQIPYIKAPSKPGEHRGNIDDLLDALIDRLKTLEDGRVIISGGSDLSSPAHVAWYFKSKGVDIKKCLKVMDKHHTKGMVVDGKRVLIGSHNWSPDGVTLNRDASLIIHAPDAANYYAEAFEIDWERANSVAPKKFVKKPKEVREAVGGEAPEGYVRVPLKEVLADE